MKIDDLDAKMRLFETAHDHCVLPEIFMVARMEGRNFSRITKETHQFEAPFDVRFRDCMVGTVEHLMNCGFRATYGYNQSDEISLLFHREEPLFDRNVRKFISVLAGEASAAFSLRWGAHACFDCRISQLPTKPLTVDYFRWRQENVIRNALNSHCYWVLRKEGKLIKEATAFLGDLSVSEKQEFLSQRGLDFNQLPNWQKNGISVYWESYEKEGFNPKTRKPVKVHRQRLKADFELPANDAYGVFMQKVVEKSSS